MDKLNLTDLLVENILEASSKPLENEIRNHAINTFIDYIGVTIAGAYLLNTKNNEYLNTCKTNDASCSVIGIGRSADIYTASFLNGYNCHFTELDDGNRFGMIHLGAPILSALVPVAEMQNCVYERFLKGIIYGYEVAIRLSRAIQPYHKTLGFHTTGTVGTIGAAIAVAIMEEFSFSQIKSVLSAAVSSAAGVLEIQENNSELKPYNAGRAAASAITASQVGRIFKGPSDIIGGSRGFLSVFGGKNLNTTYITDPIDDAFAIKDIYRKPYACCRHSHSAIQAVADLIKIHKIHTEDMAQIEVDTYQNAVVGHDHNIIHGITSAKMSIPFSIAVSAITGEASLNSFTEETIHNGQIIELMNKVIIRSDPIISSMEPKSRAARVTIRTKDGNVFENIVYNPKGEPENPMDESEIENKFLNLWKFSNKSISNASAFIQFAQSKEPDIASLIKLVN
jgi:2-methylcitrate dehydratase PrpD